MKLPESNVSIEGNLIGQRIDMQIDPAAVAHIMQALQKLYSDNETAVLRELATNARDAHIEAGRAHLPIEVTLPTNELADPFLVIKDFGPGLSVDDITNIYSRYGVSTKRDTNEQTGSLGFGCKSPLAYTDQFTLTSVCNGVKILVVISKDERGGNMQIVDTSTTDEHSGVTMQIPVARYHNFAKKAERLFRFWEPGTVLVNGRDPERIKGRVLTDDLMIIPGSTSYVVMGNVPYPVDREHLDHGLNDGHSLVARVPLGSVEFVPSREMLDYSVMTRNVLKEIHENFEAAIKTAVQASIDACATRPEVIEAILDWHRTLPEARVKGEYTFKGKPVPRIYEVPNAAAVGGPRAIITQRSSSKLSRHERRERIDMSWWVKSLYVVNYDREGFSPTTKKKLNQFAVENNISPDNYVLLPFKPARAFTQWIPKDMIVDFEKVAAIKLPRTYNGGRAQVGRIPGSYDMYIDGKVEYGVEADDIDQTKPLFYYVGKVHEANYQANALKQDYPECTVVTLSSNRVVKFTRSFPQAIYAYEGIKKAFKAWKATLTENDKIAIALNYSGHGADYQTIDPTLVDDPAIKQACRIVGRTKHQPARDMYTRYRNHIPLKLEDLIKYDSPLNKYPLFDRYTFRSEPDHTYQYLNALYAYLTAK